MPDAITTQFGALEKLIKSSAKADMEHQLAQQLFQIGQQKAMMAAQEEMQLAQAEAEGAAQQQANTPVQPFQLELPNDGALAERPVAFRNPLSQLSHNAFSTVAGQNPGAMIQQQLRDSGAVPPGVPDATAGLPIAGDTLQTLTAQLGSRSFQQPGEVMTIPTVELQMQQQPNQLTAADLAQLRGQQIAEYLRSQATARENEIDNYAAAFKNLVADYGPLVHPSKLADLARAMAKGDNERVKELSDALPKIPAKADPSVTNDETTMRREFEGLSGDFIKVRDAAMRIQESANDPSAAGDLALIFSYMRILDPGSTVREGEFANAQNTAGVPDRVRTMYNRLLSGERLAPAQRADFTKQAGALFNSQLRSHIQLEQQYTGLAERKQFDPRNVVTDLVPGELRAAYAERGKEPKPAVQSETVRIVAPDGRSGTIPRDRLADAIRRGAKVAP